MNGFTSFVASFCLIAVGLLIGWVASASFGSNSWNALSAIGGWVGGLGAFYAAYVATKIAREQADRDTYKLYIEAIEVEQNGVVFRSWAADGSDVKTRGPGHLVIKAYNSGLRPIELIKLIYQHEHGNGQTPIDGCVVEAGKRAQWEYLDYVLFVHGTNLMPIFSNQLLDGELQVMDAAGVIHEVHKVR